MSGWAFSAHIVLGELADECWEGTYYVRESGLYVGGGVMLALRHGASAVARRNMSEL